jgi:RHS repeat-associated protein
MNLYYKKIIFLAWIGVLFALHVSGQQQPVVAATPLAGDSVKAGKHLVVQDSVYYNEDDNDHIVQTNSVDNILSLYINEFTNRKIPDTFHVVVRVNLNYTTTSGSGTKEDTLIIFYSKDNPYKSKAIKHYQNYESLDAEILSVVITGETDTAWVKKFLVMENMISINRSFTTTCSLVSSVDKDVAQVQATGELKVYWAAQEFIPAYDLQWTYIDSAAITAGVYTTSGSLDPALIFKNNFSRVIIAGNSYKIPLLYDGSGALYFRVRTVQYAPDGEVIFGNWSSGTNNLGSYGFRGHERQLNWQATTSFAEEGKRKSVVQYFDGSLKGRQTVTKDNTTDKTIVAETLYDKQGRPVIQVLPAPTLSSLIKYNAGFNVKDINSSEYDKSVYDTLINPNSYCDLAADAMSVVNGASLYYSSSNSLSSTSYHQYIPNANGFAFAETRYTRDNTGRIDRQGGVGDSMRLGTGHETRYFYGSPSQKELDALFGTEAGDASHYEKNMVRDANGQYSVSYADMHGRTVATALAGDTIISRQYQLPSYNSVEQTDQLLTPANNIIKDNSIESTSSLLVPKAGTYTFKYVVKPESLSLDDCTTTPVCYDCLYDLTITISNNCNNDQVEGFPKIITRRNFSLFKADGVTHNIDTTCAVADSFIVVEEISLKEGSYDVTKVLSLSKEGMRYYRDSLFLPHNTCKTFAKLLAEQLDSIRSKLDCDPDTLTTNLVSAWREQMMADLVPLTGQYGNPDAGASCYSIFEQNDYRIGGYKDEEGNPDFVNHYNGTDWELVPPGELTPEEFIANFKQSWAETLLPLHPEYLLLVEYEKLQNAYAWEADFFKTETYADALEKGYLNPLASTNAPANRFTVSGTIDALFTDISIHDPASLTAAKTSIENSMMNYLARNESGQYYNLWGLCTAIIKCNAGNENCYEHWNNNIYSFNADSLCTADLDQAWRLFRSLYLEIRGNWIDDYTRGKSGIPSSQFNNTCRAVFPDHNFSTATQNDPSGQNDTYGGYNGTATDITTAATNRDQFYEDNCTAYATRWMQELRPCGYTQADYDAIIPMLIAVCKEGADQNHPFGASTVKPSSPHTTRSFEQVIEEYNAAHYTGVNQKDPLACNAYLITSPKPFDQRGIIVNQPIIAAPDSCTCSRINELYGQYTSNSSSFTSFSNYLQIVHGAVISEGKLDTLRNLCNNASTCRYLEKPILLPPALQCGPILACATCSDVRAAYDSFKAKFPGASPVQEEPDSATQHVNRVFANYMNHHLGFSKQAYEYLLFMESCPPPAAVQCDSTRWTVYNPGANLEIKADLYANAYNNIPPGNAQFFSNGHFNSPTTLQAAHYVLVNKIDSLVADTITLMMQWRVQLNSYPGMTDPFIQRGNNITYVGAEWIQDPMDNNWWIGATILRGEHGSVIKGIGLASNHPGLKADWVKIINPATSEVFYFQDFSATGLCDGASGPFLCGIQAQDSSIQLNMSECADSSLFATQNATYLFDLYRHKLKGNFEKLYSRKCMDAGKLESFTVAHPLTEYHYTLYYYDQAGNLVKTVPPEGVHLRRDSLWYDSVKNYRAAREPLPARHTLATTYRYNSLNQVITQHSPDGGLNKFWYDRLGRLVVSQNAKQAAEDRYSYTIYDALGRITEVGQKKQTTAVTDVITRNQTSLDTLLGYTYTFDGSNDVIAEQVTNTVYDVKDPLTGSLPNGYLLNYAYQKAYTLRNRVSYTRYYDKMLWNSLDGRVITDYDNSTTYSYDIHGNVDTLVHHYRTGMMANNHGNNQFKAIAYKYDLISGKVNEVHYQPGMADQFYHRYEYDAENRLTDVYTTDRKQLLGIPAMEEHDARYNYYRHGPLARTVLGQQQVQGIDYQYTLQGWLKGVNSDSLLDQDANNTATDAYRFFLNYFNNDYHAIGVFANSIAFSFDKTKLPAGDYRPLYNGNISSMVVGIPQLGETRVYNYAYDQLNRLVKMDAYTGYDAATHTWGTLDSHGGEYMERIAYDANGNILKYLRSGHRGKVQMDSLSYYYNRTGNDLTNNRLRHVKDAVGDNNYTVATDDIADIDSQPDDNYEYDAIGNLIKDTKEGITNISWTVYGKIKEITKTDGTVIRYTYDVAGNRISKAVTKNSSTTTTWYARDVQGNPMAIYTGTNNNLTLNEHQLYGSGRLGVWNRNIDMDAIPNATNYTYERGNKFFELSNHLGNVLVTISDKKSWYCHDPLEQVPCTLPGNPPATCECATSPLAVYNRPDVVTANDYYPFGMLQPGRKYNAGSLYRYGFNGKENDNDVKGEGNQQDYGMRIYDPRVGRFLSVDPLTKKFPFYSPYHYAGNSPIKNIDMDGAEPSGNPWDWKSLQSGKTYTALHRLNDGTTAIARAEQTFIEDKKGWKGWVTHMVWTETYHGISAKANYYSYFNEDPNLGFHPKSAKRWEAFETSHMVAQKQVQDMAKTLQIGVFGTAVVLAASPFLVSTSGLSGTGLQAELGRRFGAAAGDAAVQGMQMLAGTQDKYNWLSTFGSFVSTNPAGGAAWSTTGEVINEGAKGPGDVLFKFGMNLAGDILSDQMSRGLIKNSPSSKVNSPLSNAVNSTLGNTSGNSAAFIVETYRNIADDNKIETKKPADSVNINPYLSNK